MLRSLRAAFAALALCLALPNAFAFKDYQDWWWDAAQSGMGFNIGQQGSTVFVMWFLYGDDGKGTFLQLSGAMSDDGFLQGTLYQFLGQQLEQAVLTDEVFRFLVISQQAVDQFVRDGHLFAFPLQCSSFLPIDRLHKSSYTP